MALARSASLHGVPTELFLGLPRMGALRERMRTPACLAAVLLTCALPASAEEAVPSSRPAAPPVLAPPSDEPAPEELAAGEPPPDEPVPEEPAAEEPTPEEVQELMKALEADQAASTPLPGLPEVEGALEGALSATTQAFQSMNPDIALILDVAGAWFSQDKTLQLGGHDPSKTGFTLQQLELAAGASVDPFFRFDANLVFSQFGVEVEEAYATTLGLPWALQLRAGQFLTRFGRQNPTHPHSWSFVDQPLVLGKMFGSEGSRGLGAEVSWLSPLPWYAELVVSATSADGECCARSFYGADDLGTDTPADLLYTAALKQFFPLGDDWSLLWGLSTQLGPNPTGRGNRSEIYGTDLYLRWRPTNDPDRTSVSLQAEALLRRRQVPGDVLTDAGYYAQVVWQLLRQWELGARAEGVSGVADDYLDPGWPGFAQRYSVEAAFYPSHFSRLRAQGAVSLPPDGGDPIWAAMLSLEVLVGAHGSHTY